MIAFDEALAATDGQRRHLLLGNGFSIALFPDRFTYKSLLQQAKDEGLFATTPELEQAFEILETTDFETVLSALVSMRKLIHLYSGEPGANTKIAQHAEHLKHTLVQAIAGKHPERLSGIDEKQFQAVRAFLGHFSGKGLAKPGCVYTLNYDLLLYWSLLHEPGPEWDGTVIVPPLDEELIEHDDGFRAPPNDYDAPYVTWDLESGSNKQNIHYIHGGLHLFDAGDELQKFCWERSGKPLMDQIHEALDTDRFPMFVSEGTSESKLTKILHSGYLTRSLKSFAAVCASQSNNLFVYGHSLAESDEHILQLIERGKCKSMYVSIYGDPESDQNAAIIHRAELISAARDWNPLKVQFFDAGSAHVWG
jgi:hypothetical protein